MSITFTARDIYEMARQIEENGAQFYRDAAKIFPDRATCEVLLDLAGQEDGHRDIFEGMRVALREGADLQWENYPPETLRYLRAFASGEIFDLKGGAAAELHASMSPGEILIAAVGKERDAILFYIGMKDLAITSADSEKIDAVIQEEKRHITILLDQIEEHGGI